jgi:hypothetical protein
MGFYCFLRLSQLGRSCAVSHFVVSSCPNLAAFLCSEGSRFSKLTKFFRVARHAEPLRFLSAKFLWEARAVFPLVGLNPLKGYGFVS